MIHLTKRFEPPPTPTPTPCLANSNTIVSPLTTKSSFLYEIYTKKIPCNIGFSNIEQNYENREIWPRKQLPVKICPPSTPIVFKKKIPILNVFQVLSPRRRMLCVETMIYVNFIQDLSKINWCIMNVPGEYFWSERLSLELASVGNLWSAIVILKNIFHCLIINQKGSYWSVL